MAVKPQFALAILLPSLWLAVRSWLRGERNWPWFVVNQATVTAGVVVVFFQGIVYLLFPAFFRDVLPMVLQVYVPVRQSLPALLLPMKGFLFPALLVLPLLYCPRAPQVEVLAAAGLGFFAAFLIQGKGWPYHLFPATSYGLFLFFSEVLPHIWSRRQSSSPIVALLMAALILSIHTSWMMVTWMDWSALTRAIVATGIRQPTILNIAASHEVGHPSTRDAGGRWVGTFSCRWLTVLTAGTRHEAEGMASNDPLAAWAAHDREVLRRDIADRRPDIIIVDRRGDFDWLTWARQDADTARLLNDYTLAGQIFDYDDVGNIELLRRTGDGDGIHRDVDRQDERRAG